MGLNVPSLSWCMTTKPGGKADTLEGIATIQRDLSSWNVVANKNCMRCSKDKCNVLYLGQNNSKQLNRLGLEAWGQLR